MLTSPNLISSYCRKIIFRAEGMLNVTASVSFATTRTLTGGMTRGPSTYLTPHKYSTLCCAAASPIDC